MKDQEEFSQREKLIYALHKLAETAETKERKEKLNKIKEKLLIKREHDYLNHTPPKTH